MSIFNAEFLWTHNIHITIKCIAQVNDGLIQTFLPLKYLLPILAGHGGGIFLLTLSRIQSVEPGELKMEDFKLVLRKQRSKVPWTCM